MLLVETASGRIVDANPAASAYYGYAREQMIGMPVRQIDAASYEDNTILERTVEAGQNYFNGRHRLASGEERDVEVYSSPVDLDGVSLQFSIVYDITRRKQAQQELRASEAFYRTVFQTSLDAISISRLQDGMYVDVSKSFLDLMGYEREEVIGRTSLELNIWASFDDRRKLADRLRQNADCHNMEVKFRKKSGETFSGLFSASLVELDDASYFLSVLRNISEAKEAEGRIRDLAFYDPLTHLPNRHLLMDRLGQTPSGRNRKRKRALLFVDIDDFRTLNEAIGRETGDILLQEVARRLIECVRESDTVARLSGDEFGIMLEYLSDIAEQAAAQAQVVAEKIKASVGRPFSLAGREFHKTASIGISIFSAYPENANDVLQQAEIAMNLAKTAGRNTKRFFAPALQANVNARAVLEQDIRQAIKERQFVLYYQPQVEDSRLIGVEALLRWNHPERGILPPSEFIPFAEETGLILPLGIWALDAACTQIAAWESQKEMANVSVAANISARQFRQPIFIDQVLSALHRTGANPANLKLELTESMLVENFEDVIAKMTVLKSHGLTFSMDDFGTGYSSLAYLKRLPLDQLKIDRAFIRDVLVDVVSGAIAQTVISLSKAMGLSVIAEGVETVEQRDFLVGLGCHAFQGYLFSRPLPVQDISSWVSKFNLAAR